MKTLGIIPARSGSKSVKDKNIKLFLDKPLIYYTIKSALSSKYIDKLIVSTDSEEIARISIDAGAQVPFLRPKELAEDNINMQPVLKHAIIKLQEQGYIPDFIISLQPTAPLRKTSHIDEAIELLTTSGCEVVISIVPVKQHPYWMVRVNKKKDVVYLYNEKIKSHTLRQFLPPVYAITGAVLAARKDVILDDKLYDAKTKAIILDEISGMDINTTVDFKLCELLAKEYLHQFDS